MIFWTALYIFSGVIALAAIIYSIGDSMKYRTPIQNRLLGSIFVSVTLFIFAWVMLRS